MFFGVKTYNIFPQKHTGAAALFSSFISSTSVLDSVQPFQLSAEMEKKRKREKHKAIFNKGKQHLRSNND